MVSSDQDADFAYRTRPSGPAAPAPRAVGRGVALQLWTALAYLAVGQAFVFLRVRPLTDYYFLLVWGGYILLADYLVYRRAGRSLLRTTPGRFLAMFPVSSLFWWVFELYNESVQNWDYLGSADYVGLAYVVVASLFFSTVLPAVWETAELLLTFPLDGRILDWAARILNPKPKTQNPKSSASLPGWLPPLGALLSLLPLLAPSHAFPLVWVGLFVLLDPLNARVGRPSILAMLQRGQWRLPAAFYLGTTITGFFWEFWNYWAWPKWVYTLSPAVESFPRLFEMPLPGYLGYGPFGWELFALWQLLLAVGGWLAWGARSRAMAPRASPSVPDRR